MRHIRKILFVLAAILWLPMSAHCQLEKIPGISFLACSSENASEKSPDCEDDGCCSAEKAQYKVNPNRVTIPSPDLLPLLPFALTQITETSAVEIGAIGFVALPADLPKCWQFVFRTASSPRAPSFAS